MKRHLKRLRAPRFWKVPKKTKKWVVRPRAGPHKKFECIPLLVLIRDVLGLTDLGRDAKRMIKSGEVFVDGVPRKDHKYPAGFMDVVEIPRMNKSYRIIVSQKGLELLEIPKKERKLKVCRINGKNLIKRGIIQLNLHDGRNINIPVKDPKKPKKDVYKSGDSLLIEVPSQKIIDHIKMEKGNLGLIIGGQNVGSLARIKEVITTRSREPNKILCETKEKEFEAIKDYVFVVGKTKPLVTVGGK